jgi:Carbohydrate esterase, sialic acid-specific acetylesterase
MAMTILSKNIAALCGLSLLATSFLHAADLPDPDGKPADMSKPVQVFLIMGQSNTLEMGKVTPNLGELYPFLVDDAGKQTVRQDLRNVSVMVGKGVYRNEWLTLEGKSKIGIEIGIGQQLGNAIDAPVMVLKSSIGNRSLGWDLLPPGSPRYTHDGKDQPGYREYADGEKILPYQPGVSKVIGKKGPSKGKETDPWYAGKQYDDDIANAKKVLEDLGTHYPGATKYEVAGFLWWQGDKDRYNAAHASQYEKNLVNIIHALRKEFNAPNAKFVCATLGQTAKDAPAGNDKLIFDAQMAVDGESGKYPEFKGNVATVYTHPLSKGGASNGHYNGNAETYMNVGLGMGEAMAKLLKGK